MHTEIEEAIRGLFDNPVLIDNRLYYHTVSEDKTEVRHPLDRPRDIDKGVMRHLCNRLPPELSRAVRRADIIAFLRSVATVREAPPKPWEVEPNAGYGGPAMNGDGGLRALSGPAFVRLMVSQIIARRRDPGTRVPIVFIVGQRSYFPAVTGTLSNLCGGAVHVYAPGHGNPPRGTLAIVFDTPPASGEYLSPLWLAVRGGTDPAPVPVVMCDYSEWARWKRWMLDRAPNRRARRERKSELMPPMWAYETTEETRVIPYHATSVMWAGALALVRDKGLPAYLPEHPPGRTVPTEGPTKAIVGAVGQWEYWHADDEPEFTASEDTDPGGPSPPGSSLTRARAGG